VSYSVILVGRRGDRGRRDRLWRFCSDWWTRELGWPIFVGVHDDPGPFSLAAASNRAAALAGDWTVALYVGADVVLGGPGQAREAVRLAVKRGQLVFAHDHYYSLSREGTEAVLAGAAPHGSMNEWPGHGPWPNTFSSALAVPRALWDAVGGFDERFTGPWGGEDLAFWSACCALGRGFDRVTGPVFHCWHERDRAQREGHPNYPAADELMRRYLAAKANERLMRAILTEPGGPLDRE
jgi:hypothetical protein